MEWDLDAALHKLTPKLAPQKCPTYANKERAISVQFKNRIKMCFVEAAWSMHASVTKIINIDEIRDKIRKLNANWIDGGSVLGQEKPELVRVCHEVARARISL